MTQPGSFEDLEGASPGLVLPTTRVDPLASLDIRSVLVDFHGVEYEIPPFPAATWLTVLMDPQFTWLDVFPGMLDQEPEAHVLGVLNTGDADTEEVMACAREAVEAAAGRKWFIARNMCALAAAAWDRLGGYLIRDGINPRLMPLGAWLDAAWTLILEKAHPDKVASLVLALTTNPTTGEPDFDEDVEAAAFMAMAGQDI